MNRFGLGTIHISPGAEAALAAAGVSAGELLARHRSGDWGELEEHDRRDNEFVLSNPGTAVYVIGSLYPLAGGTRLLVLTSANQSRTDMVLESEEQDREVDVLEGYAVWAAQYANEPNPLIAAEAEYVYPLLADLAIDNALDVAAGTGRYALLLARRGIRVTAFDQSPEMLAVARQQAQAEGLAIEFHLGALEHGLPFRDGQFGFVVCALALCHVADLAGAIGECGRVLRPGGYLLITDFHPEVAAEGWRTMFLRGATTYLLPDVVHTRQGYLDAVVAAGCDIQNVIDIRVRDVPSGYFQQAMVDDVGDKRFGLVVFARKHDAAA